MKRSVKTRAICVWLALSCAVSLSGCWDMRDINERAYVLGIGIDPAGGGEYTFSFCCYLPASAGASVTGRKLSATVIAVRADSMAPAVRELNKSTSHDAVLEQLACIAVSGRPDGEELLKLLDYPLRHPQVRRQCMVVASDCPALELMSCDPGESSAPVEIASLLEQQDNSRRQSSSAALYRLGEILSEGCDFILYRIKPERLPDSVSTGDIRDTLSVTGTDVYRGMRYSGSLDHAETELARLFFDRQTSGIISVARRGGEVIYYEIKHSQCSVRFRLEDERPCFDIKLRVECALADSGGADTHTAREITVSLYDKLGAIVDKCLDTLGSAPLGAQPVARQQNWRWYSVHKDSWTELFSESAVRLDIDCLLDQDEALNTMIQ